MRKTFAAWGYLLYRNADTGGGSALRLVRIRESVLYVARLTCRFTRRLVRTEFIDQHRRKTRLFRQKYVRFLAVRRIRQA